MKYIAICFTGMASLLCGVFFAQNAAAAARLCDTHRHSQAYETQSICVSSALKPKGRTIYDIRSLSDGDDGSSWCEGREGDGVGETIIVRLENAASPENFWIRNGYGKSEETFRRNGRVRTMEMVAISYNLVQPERRTEITLKDISETQPVPIPWVVDDPRYFELRITSVYPGRTTEHTCISAFSVDYGM